MNLLKLLSVMFKGLVGHMVYLVVSTACLCMQHVCGTCVCMCVGYMCVIHVYVHVWYMWYMCVCMCVGYMCVSVHRVRRLSDGEH